CYNVTIMKPSPFMGNNDEIFQLSDGSIWQVKYEYNYMYEYYPEAVICPSSGKLIVKGKPLNVILISGSRASSAPTQRASGTEIVVVLVKSGCGDYFVADGPRGYYLLEWYGGHSPSAGDVIVGDIAGYGFKDIYYSNVSAEGRVYVDDYMLSRSRVIEKYAEKCR
ncbi:MAG: hypothetical protein ABW360_12600, partial [Phenylobacterium sp.]